MHRRKFVVKALVAMGAALGIAGVATSLDEPANAARRPTPTPRPPAPCPGVQVRVNGVCICPPAVPFKAGSDCCATFAQVCDSGCCPAGKHCCGEEICCPDA